MAAPWWLAAVQLINHSTFFIRWNIDQTKRDCVVTFVETSVGEEDNDCSQDTLA